MEWRNYWEWLIYWYRSGFLTACCFHWVRSNLFQPCCKYMSGCWIVKRRFSLLLLVVKKSIKMAENMKPPSWLYYVQYVASWVSRLPRFDWRTSVLTRIYRPKGTNGIPWPYPSSWIIVSNKHLYYTAEKPTNPMYKSHVHCGVLVVYTTWLLSNSPAHSHSWSLSIVVAITNTDQLWYKPAVPWLLNGVVLYHPWVNDVLPRALPSEGHH